MTSKLASLMFSNPAIIVSFICATDQIKRRLGRLVAVHGSSMHPTFAVDRYSVVVMEKVSVHTGRVKVGDVVTLRSPLFPKGLITKRVLGLEGDVIRVAPDRALGPGRLVEVPPGHVWVQGDNLPRSRDSRVYGPLPYAMLEGTVRLQVWPLSGFGFVKSFVPEETRSC